MNSGNIGPAQVFRQPFSETGRLTLGEYRTITQPGRKSL